MKAVQTVEESKELYEGNKRYVSYVHQGHVGFNYSCYIFWDIVRKRIWYKKQHSVFVFMVADHNGTNIVLYRCGMSKNISWSVTEAEMHGLVKGFEHAYMVRKTLEERLLHLNSLEVFV